MINFPEINDNDKCFSGYMGHDSFAIESNKRLRKSMVAQLSWKRFLSIYLVVILEPKQ